MLSLQSLPAEILIKIFRFIGFKDNNLLHITETSKRFSEIISNEKSLMGLLALRVTEDNFDNEWIGSRKYQSLMIETDDEEQIAKFFAKFNNGNDIKQIFFLWLEASKTLKVETVLRMLKLCPNVKQILRLPMIEGESEEILELKLEKLSAEINEESLNFLSNAQVDDLMVNFAHGIKNFLANQKSLKRLSISMFHFDSCLSENFHFPLEHLNISGRFPLTHEENFQTFLRNHSETLKSVTIFGNFHLEILQNFSECKNLQKLQIGQIRGRRRSVNFDGLTFNNVTEFDLTFYQDIEFCISKVFPNLRRLKLINPERVFIQSFGDFPFLEELQFNDAAVNEIPKNVRKLTFSNINFEYRPKFHDNSKIEELTLYNCKNLNWLGNFFATNKVQLKKIKVRDVQLGLFAAPALRSQAERFGNVDAKRVKCVDVPLWLKEEVMEIFRN